MVQKRSVWIILGIILGLILLMMLTGGIFILRKLSIGGTKVKVQTPLAEKYEAISETPTKAPQLPSTAVGKENIIEQKVIKTANLTLEVVKVGDAINEINSLAVSKGGFILSSSVTTNPDETQSASVILKIPASKFEETIKEIKELAKKVELEKISGQDVTEEYIDLQSQLKNFRAEEAQYLEILKKATTIDEILNVTERLAQVREKIEMTEGRIKYLESQTDMSTITLTLKEEARFEIPTKEWRPLNTLKLAFRAWVRFLQWLVNILIWLVIFLFPPAILIWLAFKIFKWKRKRKEIAKSK